MKEDTRLKLLMTGAEIMHLKGFNHTGIQEILDKAGVPKGSFYNYFKSKEDFGLQVIDFFMDFFSGVARQFFEDAHRPPLERMRLLFEWFMEFFKSKDFAYGCPIGNFAQEMGDVSPAFREKLKGSLDAMAGQFAKVLKEAKARGEIPSRLDVHETADFIVTSWEGALMRMKVDKSTGPLETHAKFIFDHLLKT